MQEAGQRKERINHGGKQGEVGCDQLCSGLHFEAVNKERITVQLDTSAADGGTGGFSPMELMLVSLGGCTGMDVISILHKMRQDVTSYRVDVSGVQATEYPHVFTEMTIHHIIQGNDVREDAVLKAIELSETKYCSAHAMLEKAAKITSSYEISRPHRPTEGEVFNARQQD